MVQLSPLAALGLSPLGPGTCLPRSTRCWSGNRRCQTCLRHPCRQGSVGSIDNIRANCLSSGHKMWRNDRSQGRNGSTYHSTNHGKVRWILKEATLFRQCHLSDMKIFQPHHGKSCLKQRATIGKFQVNIPSHCQFRSCGIVNVNQLEHVCIFHILQPQQGPITVPKSVVVNLCSPVSKCTGTRRGLSVSI